MTPRERDMELDVSYEALLRELKKHGSEVRKGLYESLLETSSFRNLARSSGDEASHKSFKEGAA